MVETSLASCNEDRYFKNVLFQDAYFKVDLFYMLTNGDKIHRKMHVHFILMHELRREKILLVIFLRTNKINEKNDLCNFVMREIFNGVENNFFR